MNRNVMIVDDDPAIRLTLSAILESSGFNVTAAEEGHKCLEELEKGFKGVVLMDIMMPRMDGWETIREMESRGLTEGNIVSMLTAKDVPDDDMEMLAENVLNYIRKPFEANDLVSIVEEYCSYLD